MSAEVMEIAQNLARNCGYYVFPCRVADKRPATPHGFKDAETDVDAIARLWRRYPGDLIGVAAGELSGVSILDVDVKHDAARAWWRQNESRLPATRTYRTRSGGLHLLFLHAVGVRNIEGKPVQGIDVRGQGGYFIHWFATGLDCLDHTPAAAWPAWLTNFFWQLPKAVVSASSTSRTPLSDADLDRVKERAIDRVRDARDGERHNRLRTSAKLLGGIQSRAGFDDAQAVEWLLDASDLKAEKKARNTVEWGLAKGRESPLELRARS